MRYTCKMRLPPKIRLFHWHHHKLRHWGSLTRCGSLQSKGFLTRWGCLTWWCCLTSWGCLTKWDCLPSWGCSTALGKFVSRILRNDEKCVDPNFYKFGVQIIKENNHLEYKSLFVHTQLEGRAQRSPSTKCYTKYTNFWHLFPYSSVARLEAFRALISRI